jgi:O-antigen/teichoic acid export membrane protein
MINNLKEKAVRALRWSQKYTKTDMVYLAKGGGWLSIGQVVEKLSALGLAIAFANLIPQETYGTYKYIISLGGIIAIFTLSGLRTAVTQAVARGYEGSLEFGFKEML